MDRPNQKLEDDDSPIQFGTLLKKFSSWSVSVLSIILMVGILVAITQFAISGDLHPISLTGNLAILCFALFLIVSLGLWIIYKYLIDAYHRGKTYPSDQTPINTPVGIQSVKQKENKKSSPGKFWPTIGKFLHWSLKWQLIIAAFLIAFYIAPMYFFKDVTPRQLLNGQTSATPSGPTPSVCKDSWAREAKDIGNHLEEADLEFFDITPSPGCFEQWNRMPRNWSRWGFQFMDSNPKCFVWFWYYGSEKPIGPYYQNNLPDLPVGSLTKWRVYTNCTIRYFRTR